MTKSWKKLVKTTDFGSNSENSISDIQLTLDEIAAQNIELDHLLKERQSLENEMSNLLQPNNPVEENPRFTGTIESFKSKREKEKNRAAQKKKLEERLLKKSKELENWEKNQDRLRKKLALQKKSLLKKETEQDPSTSLKAPKSTKKDPERKWFNTNTIREKKDVIERKKKVLTEPIEKVKQVPDKIRELKPKLDLFGQKDLVKFQQKLDQEKKAAVIPTRIRRIKDDWDEKYEIRKEKLKEKLKEKVPVKKLSEKLEETKRFGQSVKSDIKNSVESLESKVPEMKEMTEKLEKELSLDDRQNKVSENAAAKKAEQKESEQKETERREKLKERFLSRKKAERKEEERSNRKKERKNEKYI